ncbi:MAG: polysulfide reductase NrfD [Armatimonadetes bacterium]|nr:polysulfide reductase NrfD [Armatimonadota bacterium]
MSASAVAEDTLSPWLLFRHSAAGRVTRLLWNITMWAVAVFGIGVLLYRLAVGLGITRLGSTVPWGLWVAFYIYFIGLSAGSFLLSSLVFVFGLKSLETLSRLAVVQAFVCLLIGLVFIFLDLGHWERFYYVMRYPQWHSVLAWEIWFYNAYLVILLMEQFFLMRCDLARWSREVPGAWGRIYKVLSLGFICPDDPAQKAQCDRQSARWLYYLGAIGIPIALGVHGGTGAIFAVVKSRPAWYSPIFPLVFIISALASGGGLLLFLRVFVVPEPAKDRETLPQVANLVAGFLIFDVLLLFLEFLVGIYGGMPDHTEPYRLMTNGPFAWVFWFQQLGLGVAIPLLLLYARPSHTKYKAEEIGIAGLLIFVGIFGVRLNIVIPALAVPVLRGFDLAMASPRMHALYVPNWVEWMSSLGVVALAIQMTRWALHRLPMREHQEPPVPAAAGHGAEPAAAA